MSDIPEFEIAETRDLTYRGRVNPDKGSTLGPDLKGRLWVVVGAQYDEERDITLVTVERPQLIKS